MFWANETYQFTTSYSPQLSNPDPENESLSVTTPICNVTVSDQDGGIVTVRFYENSSNGWVLQQTNNSVDVTSPANVVWNNYNNATAPGTKYWWKVNVSDGKGCFVEEIYWFNTTADNPPVLSNENPTHLSTGVSSSLSIINVTITDDDGDNMNWTIETSPNIGSNSSTGAGNGSISCDVSGLNSGTTYYWYVNVTDDIMWTNETYSFTTSYAPTIDLIAPSPNGTTGVSLQPNCQIWANDTDGDTLIVYWYENSTGGYILRNTNSSVTANSTVGYTFTQFNGYGNTYYWKVAVNDSTENTTAWFYFTTEPINTSVDSISPYITDSSPLTITATNNTPADNVTLWYRYSTVNGSWAHYETGVEQNVNGWTTVNLNNTYNNPIVIVTGQEGEDISLDIEKSRPMIRNVGSNSFEVRVMNDTGAIVTEDVGYIVMEKGHWVIDGVEVEAGNYTVSDAASHTITFIESFPGNTVVVDTIQEETTVAASSRYTEDSMTSTGYTVYWEGYDDNSNLATVTAGYIAVELGSSSSIFESGIADEVADDPDSGTWTSISFSNSYSVTPILFTNPLDTNGGDPVVVGIPMSTVGLPVSSHSRFNRLSSSCRPNAASTANIE